MPEQHDMRIAVAAASFNESITRGLLGGALEALDRLGISDPTVVWAPGSFELPVVAAALADAGHDGVVALGAVIKGETDHYEHIAAQCAAGLQQVSVQRGIPVGFGVLTVRDARHARERSAPGPGNKGAETAEAVVAAVAALRQIRGGG
jgi:6,7-dimethyl-8-ribityllumazine synthase